MKRFLAKVHTQIPSRTRTRLHDLFPFDQHYVHESVHRGQPEYWAFHLLVGCLYDAETCKKGVSPEEASCGMC